MEYSHVLPKLDKSFILAYVTQEEIFEAYLGIKVQTTSPFCSPIRNDRNATCGFKYNMHGRLRMRDFSGDFHGDCFDAVGRMISKDSTSSQGFNIILDDIAKKFKIHKYAEDQSEYIVDFIKKDEIKPPKRSTFKHIDVVKRDWDGLDAKFWTSFGISKYTLQYFHVLPCKDVYVNGFPVYVYDRAKPCYVYYYGKDEHGRNLLKLYFPYNKKRRFITNNNVLQGYRRLPGCGRTLIITKSYKDVMAMNRFTLFGDRIYAVAPASESTIITPDQYEDLRYRFDYIFSLYDFDNLGSIRTAYKMKEKYNIQPLFLTNGKYGTKDYQAKDFSDYIKIHGIEAMNDLISNIEYQNEDLIRELDINLYNNLSWIQ